MALNITIPDVDYEHLSEALTTIFPKFISYILSFLLIGPYWIGHHFYFDRLEQVDGNLVWLNIILLSLISLMPFPTFLLGKYPSKQLPLMLYGLNLPDTNLIGFAMVYYVKNTGI